MTDNELRVLLELKMVSDPWPLSDKDMVVFNRLLNIESKMRGYNGWVDAYHKTCEENTNE